MTDYLTDVENCLEVLRSGGIILYPTDSVWGLGCDATNEMAVEKIFSIKQRPDNKTMIVLVADEREMLRYVTQPDPSISDFLKSVNKPTTVIYNGGTGVAGNIIADDGTIGIRITKEIFTKHLIKRFRKPLVSTSANLSGQPTPRSFHEITEEVKKEVNYVVKYRQDENLVLEASAVIKFNADGTVKVIRP
ncbi:MAG: L-threonylcarbamoyladenylate synthase [Chitinophagaceae bacterium]